jgi:hypothetical protein
MIGSRWIVDQVHILTRRELAAVLCELLRLGAKSQNARLNRTILRLACCCGLRVAIQRTVRRFHILAVFARILWTPSLERGVRNRAVVATMPYIVGRRIAYSQFTGTKRHRLDPRICSSWPAAPSIRSPFSSMQKPPWLLSRIRFESPNCHYSQDYSYYSRFLIKTVIVCARLRRLATALVIA